MDNVIGIILIVMSIAAFTLINIKVIGYGKYKHDILGYLIEGCEVIGLCLPFLCRG